MTKVLTPMKSLMKFSVAGGAILLALVGPMATASAQSNSSAVADLVRQGDFWRARGRGDLAAQAYNRALQLDPGNAAARRGLAGPSQAPTSTPQTPGADSGAPAQAAAPRSTPRPRAPTSTADRAGRMRVAGYAALERGELASASSQFQQALTINARDVDALGGLGVTRLRQERFKDARDLLERASQGASASRWAEALASARFFASLEDAEAAGEANDRRRSETLLNELLVSAATVEQKTLVARQLGALLMSQSRYAEARAAYAQAEGASDAAYKIANAEAAQAAAEGNAQQAENAYREALERGGSADPWLRYAFAGFLLEQGRASDGAAIIQPLETSTASDSLYAAALYYNEADRPADALRLLRRVPETGRTAEIRSLEAEIGLADAEKHARALAAAGRATEAQALLDRLNVPGASVGQQIRLGSAYYALGARDRAAALASAAAAQPGGSATTAEPLVRLLAQTGQDELALGVIQRATGGASTSPAARRLYSTLAVASADRLREDGMRAEAFDVLQSGWSVAPQDPAILVSLGRLYQEGDMTQEAAQVFELALQRKPGDPDALTGLADTSAARGDFAKARQSYRLLLRDRPQDVEAYLTGSRVEQAAGDRRAARRLLEQAQSLGQPRGLAAGSAFTVSNPFRDAAQNRTAVPINPFAPETLRGVGRSRGELVPSPVQEALAELATDDAPMANAAVETRARSGESGLSSLNVLAATIRGSIPVGQGRIGLSVAPTVVDAGDLGRSANARFGRNATAEALAIVAQQPTVLPASDSQYAAGVALSANYESPTISADVGSTPLGFERKNVQGGFTWRPRLGPNGALKVFADRRPVTDSVLSYAGALDPVSGRTWGAVMKTGGGIGASWEQGGTGLFGDAAYHAYAGQRVADNKALELNVGAYRRIYGGEALNITAGISLNYQSFDRNLSYFTLGHGGYFSPQSFVSVAFPVDARWKRGDWSLNAQFSPGYQTYQQEAAPLYPTDPTAQGQLTALKLLNNDVRAQYDSESHSGFAFSGGIEAWRQMGATAVGLDARMNTFGSYDEYRMTLRLKQVFGANP